jgi:hypothetical protein
MPKTQSPNHKHNIKNSIRLPLPDGPNGDYLCTICQKRWFSEDTVKWAIHRYFTIAGYTPKPGHQRQFEGDIRVTGPLKIEEWIIEAKGEIPAENVHAAFKEGMGQILTYRCGRGPHILYSLAMPKVASFTKQVAQIDNKDRQYLRLHWIWVTRIEVQVPNRTFTSYQVQIDCPFGSTCECQKRIGTFCFW